MTLIREGHVADEIYDRVRREFTEAELTNLTLAAATINAWNRFAISFRPEPGGYQPAQRAGGAAG